MVSETFNSLRHARQQNRSALAARYAEILLSPLPARYADELNELSTALGFDNERVEADIRSVETYRAAKSRLDEIGEPGQVMREANELREAVEQMKLRHRAELQALESKRNDAVDKSRRRATLYADLGALERKLVAEGRGWIFSA